MAACLCGLRERSAAAADDTGDGPFTGAVLKVATPGGCPLEAAEGCGLAVVWPEGGALDEGGCDLEFADAGALDGAWDGGWPLDDAEFCVLDDGGCGLVLPGGCPLMPPEDCPLMPGGWPLMPGGCPLMPPPEGCPLMPGCCDLLPVDAAGGWAAFLRSAAMAAPRVPAAAPWLVEWPSRLTVLLGTASLKQAVPTDGYRTMIWLAYITCNITLHYPILYLSSFIFPIPLVKTYATWQLLNQISNLKLASMLPVVNEWMNKSLFNNNTGTYYGKLIQYIMIKTIQYNTIPWLVNHFCC